jgi:hypothetical protein
MAPIVVSEPDNPQERLETVKRAGDEAVRLRSHMGREAPHLDAELDDVLLNQRTGTIMFVISGSVLYLDRNEDVAVRVARGEDGIRLKAWRHGSVVDEKVLKGQPPDLTPHPWN